MRTTIDLEPDVLAAIDELQTWRHLGRSQAVNELLRAGAAATRSSPPFEQRTASIGISIDVSNVGEALDALKGPYHR